MSYTIPYDSNYETWYGNPTNVTNLIATLTQVANKDSVKGRIDARWDMPDNGGVFKVLLSTDGITFYYEKSVDTNSVVLDVEAGTDYYIKIVTVLGVTESSGTTSNLIEAGTEDVPSDTTIPGIPTNLTLDTNTLIASWTAVSSTNIKYYELRTDTNTGNATNLIAQVNGTSVQTHLTSRSGTLYLYAVNTLGNYSSPATLAYSKSIATPTQPTATPYPNGFRLDLTAETGCFTVIRVDSTIIAETNGTTFTISCASGQHFVEIAYKDGFGIGSYCETINVVVPNSNTTFNPYADFDEQGRLIIYYPASGYIELEDNVMTIPENGAVMEVELERVGLPHHILHIQ